MVYPALAITLMAEGTFCAPIGAQEKAVQTMTLSTLYNLADQQSLNSSELLLSVLLSMAY